MYILWPYQGVRFFIPLLPLLWLSLWQFMRGWDHHKRQKVLALLMVLHLAASLVYWGRDIPDVWRLNRQWSDIEQIAAPIATDQRPVATYQIDRKTALMFRHHLNRRIQSLSEQSTGPAPYWVITPRSEPNLTGYSGHSTTELFKLLSAN